MADDKIELTRRELDQLTKQAVIESKVQEIEAIIPELFSSLKTLNKDVGNIPLEIVKCRQSMDEELKEYIHSEFVTKPLFEKRMAEELSAIKTQINKAGWVLSGMILAGTLINYLITYTEFLGAKNVY